jgi:uncharacterized protein YhfF/GNAT superfamily N-acetyltransferase
VDHAPDNSVVKDGRVESFWRDFRAQVRLPHDTPYQAWYFGDSPALAHELVELVLHGPKRATAGLAEFNEGRPDLQPVPGGYSVVTEHDGTPRAVIRTTTVERRPFRAVDAAFAWDEGEGDRTLADWRDGHRRYFARELAALGRDFDEGLLVDLERFELLYPFDAARTPVRCGPRIVPACLPGGLEESGELQIGYYARRHGFDERFAAERRRDIARFLDEHDGGRDGVWLLVDAGRVHGSIAIDARGATPELRWFIVDEALHGRGWGRRLMERAMAHCAERHERVVLHTFSALADARRLYEAFGFVQVGTESVYDGYGAPIVDQDFEWRRPPVRSGTMPG